VPLLEMLAKEMVVIEKFVTMVTCDGRVGSLMAVHMYAESRWLFGLEVTFVAAQKWPMYFHVLHVLMGFIEL